MSINTSRVRDSKGKIEFSYIKLFANGDANCESNTPRKILMIWWHWGFSNYYNEWQVQHEINPWLNQRFNREIYEQGFTFIYVLGIIILRPITTRFLFFFS